MFMVTGAVHSRPQLARHLDYITRHGALQLEDQDGHWLSGREATKELTEDWAGLAAVDSLRRPNSPIGRTMVFSMPPGTDPKALEDAVRETAIQLWRERFEYAWVRHADTSHPHAHLVIRALGAQGERYTPDRADLRQTRESFSEALRDRGVAAEATSRVSRGVTRRAEPIAIRKMREQYERGEGPMPRTLEAAYVEAADAVVDPVDTVRP
ncbi:MAG TPA: relaxase/mobilization nuclease domain-containing protein [Phenylobacterium sp.]|nr:relaxase/mobilization nuclease domain-containing protein [Phenylobacterium sp.]